MALPSFPGSPSSARIKISEGEAGSKHHVNVAGRSSGRRYHIASFYLQRHSRDVLNQALPPIFCVWFNKLCTRSLETRLLWHHWQRTASDMWN